MARSPLYKRFTSIYVQGLCIECGDNSQCIFHKNHKGTGKTTYSCYCSSCKYKKEKISKKKGNNKVFQSKISKLKKSYCERCKFVAIDSCQLDLDHIDGNHKNDNPSNLQTLCANCHRLKTKRNRDGRPIILKREDRIHLKALEHAEKLKDLPEEFFAGFVCVN